MNTAKMLMSRSEICVGCPQLLLMDGDVAYQVNPRTLTRMLTKATITEPDLSVRQKQHRLSGPMMMGGVLLVLALEDIEVGASLSPPTPEEEELSGDIIERGVLPLVLRG